MTSPRILQVQDLVKQLQAAVTAAGLTKVTVGYDAAKVPSAARYGAVVAGPPRLTAETFGELVATFEVHVIAGPADNYLVAWDTIDTIIEALFAGQINIKAAEPGQYAALNGPPLPAYTLTLNPS